MCRHIPPVGGGPNWFGLWPWNGMHLTYAHWPRITIGYISLGLGGLSVVLAITGARRPGHVGLGIIPAALMAMFLMFINSSFHGHMRQWISGYRGFAGAWLGPGYWAMVLGTALVFIGAVGGVLSTLPDVDSSAQRAGGHSRQPAEVVTARDEVAAGDLVDSRP